MKTKFTLIIFFGHVVLGFSQVDFDPFDLPPFVLKEGKVKSITEYGPDQNKEQYALYDTSGNQVFYQSGYKVIKFNLDYNENGEIKNEQACGYKHRTILEKRVSLSKTGKIDSIHYTLPISLYTGGFMERYTYNDLGFLEQISVTNIPEDRTKHIHKYSYNNQNMLMQINTYLVSYIDTFQLFTKDFKYYEDGALKSMLQTYENGDTIVSRNYTINGLLEQEIMSHYYTTPSQYTYSFEIYYEFLKDLDTPLNMFVIGQNFREENRSYQPPFIYVYHTYDQGKLMNTITKVKNTHVLETVQYLYDSNSNLTRRTKINYKGDTTSYQYSNTLLSNGVTESRVNLLQNSNAHLVITRNSIASNNEPELKIELFDLMWEYKTTSQYDNVANSVTRERFRIDVATGLSPAVPEQTTIALFDQNGRLIRQTTITDYDGEKSIETSVSYYSSTGQLEKYEIVGIEYLKYNYDPINVRLDMVELFLDSLYAEPIMYYAYEYDSVGNYSVTTNYVDERTNSDYHRRIQEFDSDGKLLRQVSWALAEDEQKSIRQLYTVSYIYNEQGFCVEAISEESDIKRITRYEYEFY